MCVNKELLQNREPPALQKHQPSQSTMAALEHLPAPKGNFTPGPKCYQKCLDWVEECELLLNGPLALKSKAVKANYVLI